MEHLYTDPKAKIYVLTANEGGVRAGFVLTWIVQASLSEAPPKVVLVVSKFNATLAMIQETGLCCLNLLSLDQVELFYIFGSQSSAQVDKFEGLHFRETPYGVELDGAAGFLKLRVEESFETPDRVLLYCTVVAEHKRNLPPLTLEKALAKLSVSQAEALTVKMNHDSKRDEAQFYGNLS